MHDWLQDIRVILRGWRRTPGFSATIVLTLVLSLGLASAVFAFADGYLFKRALFPGAEQLYRVRDPGDKTYGLLKASDQIALRNSALASWGFVAFDSSSRLEGIAEIDGRRFEITSYEVSPGFQSTVQLPLLAGRDFTLADHAPGGPVPVWLSHRFWKSAFHGDRTALNQTFKVLSPFDRPIAIVVAGILGPDVTSFDGNNRPPDVIVPSTEYMATGPNLLADPIVRLPEDVTPEQAATRIAAVLHAAVPAKDGVTRSVRLRSFQQSQVAGGAPTARVLFAGALLVVLLAGINLIHLLLARGAARSAEVATRAALGASRWRLVRFFLTESMLLGATGISAGLVLGSGLASLIAESIPDYPTRGRNMAMIAMQFDARVIGFAVVLGVILSLAGGLWPAWRAVRRSLVVTTRFSSGMTDSVSSRLSRVLLSSELAVATIVMIGTLFIGLGIWRYLNQPLGFDTGDRFTISLAHHPDYKQATPEEVEAVYAAIRSVPAVKAAGPRSLPRSRGATVEVPGVTFDAKQLSVMNAQPGYFESMALRLRAGRWFSPQELLGVSAVAVIDERMAMLAWPGGSAVGRQVRIGNVMREVVGVIEPVRERLSGTPFPQLYITAPDAPAAETMALLWAPGVSPGDLQTRVTQAIRTVAPDAWVQIWPMTMDRWFLREIGEARFQMPIVTAFGVLAFLLAGVGVFGLVSYLVERRQREFGIRLALGAKPADICGSVFRLSVVPALAGLAIGGVSAWALESVVRSSVFGWQSSGLGAFVLTSAALLAVAVIASVSPARRAMRVDPAVTLRAE
jgi:predicted permease